MANVFVLFHTWVGKSGDEHPKLIGVYSSERSAEDAVGRLSKLPGFRENPSIIDPTRNDAIGGFCIDRYEVDTDNWPEGFLGIEGTEDWESPKWGTNG